LSVKIGFVGCGGIAKLHVSKLKRVGGVELRAFVDVVRGRAEELASRCGGTAYTSLEEMLRREELDAVYVCTPPYAHGFEVEIVERGIHIFVEKPVALDLKTARDVERAIARSGVISSVGYMLRYLDVTDIMREFASKSTVGLVMGFHVDSMFLPPGHWVLDKSKSGGMLVEHNTHVIDLARYVVGDIERVYAELDNRLLGDVRPGATMENEAVVALRFKCGAVGFVTGIWTSKRTRNFLKLEVYTSDYVLEHGVRYLRIYGDEEFRERKSFVDGYLEEDRAFVKAVEKGDESLIKCPYTEGVETLKVTLAANVSAAERRPVSILELG